MYNLINYDNYYDYYAYFTLNQTVTHTYVCMNIYILIYLFTFHSYHYYRPYYDNTYDLIKL